MVHECSSSCTASAQPDIPAALYQQVHDVGPTFETGMHERRPAVCVPLVYVPARGKRCTNRFDPVLLVSDGMALMNSIDH